MGKKYSVVVPTATESLALSCIQSIVDNTSQEDLNDMEIVVVDNSPNGIKVEELRVHLNVVRTEPSIGYTKAANIGISASTGEYVVLMNDDCQILPYKPKSYWLDTLKAPLVDDKFAISGIKNIFSKETKRDFLVFFLVMMKRALFDDIGMLDETFNPGGGEDIDFCARAEKAGYRITTVPEGDQSKYETEYPCWHAGEKTVHSVDGWEEGFAERMKILESRTSKFRYSTHADVTAYISTKGRYTTTLPMAISSVINQTLLPSHVVIIQDDPKEFDLRASAMYVHLFKMMDEKKIQWSVFFGENRGQVRNHQLMLDNCKTEWLWRVDDDNVAEPDVLERLCNHIEPNVGAIAGAVVDPTNKAVGKCGVKISEIDTTVNRQCIMDHDGILYEAEHLYSSFLYRKSASGHGYCLELSPAGHREETIFTHQMHRNGWKLYIDPGVVTWHLREPTGGIRSHKDGSLWDHDEKIFRAKLEEWGQPQVKRKYVNMDAGIGDHWLFKPVLEKMLEKFPDHEIVVAAANPFVFFDINNKNLKMISVLEGRQRIGEKILTDLNVYAYCMKNNWKGSLPEAMEKIYLN
jgi:GT2 family glycosyltransferase